MKKAKTNSKKLFINWFSKAQEDLKLAELAIEHNGPPWGAAFHCQQAVEKSLKAIIALKGFDTAKIHDLFRLAALAKMNITKKEETKLEMLTKYYIEARYPLDVKEETRLKEAREALHFAGQFMENIQAHAKSVKNLDI